MYLDGHKELAISERMSKNGNLVKSSEGDKNVATTKFSKHKREVEREAHEKRAEEFKHYLMDAVSVKGSEILDMDIKDLLALVVKTIPTKVEQKNETTFSFADMVVKAKGEVIDI